MLALVRKKKERKENKRKQKKTGSERMESGE